jgi:signal transduction histidine kinase/CheY-like chemotaxis protein/HAMP domain-containing protein
MSQPSSAYRFKVDPLMVLAFAVLFGLLLALVFVPAHEQTETLRNILEATLIISILGLIVIVNRRTTRRLQELAAIAHDIGHGNFQARAEIASRDAISALGRSINAMADRIESSFCETEKSQAELRSSKEALAKQNEQLAASFARQSKFGEFLSGLASIEINALANRALAYIIAAADAQVGAFFLCEDGGRRLVCLSAQGIDSAAVEKISGETAIDGLPGEALRRRSCVFAASFADHALPEINLGVARVRLQCIGAMPVVFREKPLGVLVLGSFKKPDAATIEFVNNHVDALANGLNNALGYKDLNRQSLLLEQANQELVKADRLRSEFVANMSHELRTPLNSIIGFSGILMKNRAGTLDDADLKRAEKINRNGKHLLSLINDILDLSKIEAGRMDINIAPTRVAPILREVVDLLHAQADAKNLPLVIDSGDADVEVETDDQKLKQVLINLVGNAIKFTREGSVSIGVQRPCTPGERILIRVTDTGIGIPADKLDTIFEAFRQTDSSTTREYGGTGLGLTISRSLVKLLGGELIVESTVGRGSVFKIFLPALARNTASAPVPEPPAATVVPTTNPEPQRAASAPAAGESRLTAEYRSALTRALLVKPGSKVMIVDDDPDARDLIAAYVHDLGARTILCANPKLAVATALTEQPDLITLDLMMPEKSGWDVLADLKTEPRARQIPVVIVSIVADRKKAISLGAVDALSKPILRPEFQACVERNFSREAGRVGRVLVVEDDPDTQLLLREWLSPEAAELRFAGHGAAALALLENWRPDVIFLDLQMPVMDGQTFLQQLRHDERFSRLPVIVLTAKSLTAAEQKSLESHSARVLTKGDLLPA